MSGLSIDVHGGLTVEQYCSLGIREIAAHAWLHPEYFQNMAKATTMAGYSAMIYSNGSQTRIIANVGELALLLEEPSVRAELLVTTMLLFLVPALQARPGYQVYMKPCFIHTLQQWIYSISQSNPASLLRWPMLAQLLKPESIQRIAATTATAQPDTWILFQILHPGADMWDQLTGEIEQNSYLQLTLNGADIVQLIQQLEPSDLRDDLFG